MAVIAAIGAFVWLESLPAPHDFCGTRQDATLDVYNSGGETAALRVLISSNRGEVVVNRTFDISPYTAGARFVFQLLDGYYTLNATVDARRTSEMGMAVGPCELDVSIGILEDRILMSQAVA
jgi:hypothetical protein